MPAPAQPHRVAIIGGNRTPFCRAYSDFAEADNIALLTAALSGLVERFSLHGQTIGEVQGGAVLKHSWDFNLAREAVLSSGLAAETPSTDVQMACGTGLQAALNLAGKIACGQIESAIACGVDSISQRPITMSDALYQELVTHGPKTPSAIEILNLLQNDQTLAAAKVPGVDERRTGKSMGLHCEEMIEQWGITRAEQDQLAQQSHQNLAQSLNDGFHDDLITECLGANADNNLRPDVSLEKLGTLKTVFQADGSVTAGNASAFTDGAAAVLMGTEAWAKEQGLPVLAYLSFGKTAAVRFEDGHEGLLLAPAYAVSQMLQDANLSLQDFDYYEIHEAFAGQVLCTLKAWEDETFCQQRLGRDTALGAIDRSKLNVHGSSLAAGHPFAATGARIVPVLAKLLANKGQGRGLISICTAGGMGVTAILER
ncbi:MAG: acetyl-CoA C-acetyltransferase [Gammaproteobacteria bacterium]|nr:acetyl-CoA C-acetyltransferase [Gammaproteobacteria bacterium]